MAEMLTISEIVRRTGMDRSALQRYLELPENREMLQGLSTHPQYPLESLPLFMRLAEQHSRKEITPKTLAARWRHATEEAGPVISPVSDNRNSETGQSLSIPEGALERGAEALANALVRAAERRGLIIGEDRLLSREEAARLLNCRPGGVRFRVRPVDKGRSYRLSDVQAFIRSL